MSDDDLNQAIAIFVMVGLIGTAAMSQRAQGNQARAWAEHWQYQCHVQAIAAGDQLLCNDSTTVRLIGVDAPSASSGEAGKLSARALMSIAPPGTVLKLELDEVAGDKQGRVNAYAYLPDQRMVNALMADAGYVAALPQPPNVSKQELIAAAEERAKAEQRGLWKDPAFVCFAQGADHGGCR